jgi:hypothetical protein
MTTIPANEIVAINPSVLGAGGSALDMTALMLTTSTRAPIGSVLSFPDPDSVSDYFGPASDELAAATIYFNGFDGSSKLPGAVLFAQYNGATPVAAYLRGGDASAVSLSDIQAVDGELLITVDGTLITIADVDLSSATSLSNAASILQTALQAGANPDATCVYDSISGAFVITSPTTGGSSTITFASGSGTCATVLKLTSATGAVLSQGAAATTPSTFMSALIAISSNWVTFMNVQDPDAPSANTQKLAFANWAGTTKNRFGYVAWDTDPAPAASLPAAGSLGALLTANGNSGTCLNWGPDNTKAALACGVAASIDFEELDGRITFAFKSQSGLVADVTTATAANNLGGSPQGASRGNGYNFYGAYGAANQDFVWYQRGFVTGPFSWFDSWINQVWANNRFQIALLNLFNSARSIPFTPAGDSKIESAMQDTIDAGLNFGAWAPGTITSSQKAAVNAAAGLNISDTLQAQGYYVQITPASGAVRAARGPLGIKFWYLDRGSVQSISLDSIALQ